MEMEEPLVMLNGSAGREIQLICISTDRLLFNLILSGILFVIAPWTTLWAMIKYHPELFKYVY